MPFVLDTDDTFYGYQGSYGTTGVNNDWNPNNIGSPDSFDFAGFDPTWGSTGFVDINGLGTISYTVIETGLFTSQVTVDDYTYVIIEAGGDLYIFLHGNGSSVLLAPDPFQAGLNNPLDPFCFVGGTMIEIPSGEAPIEHLFVGDAIVTRDNGIQTISWIGKRTMSMDINPRHIPIRISANALGNGLPKRDLLVSPQHRILVTDWRAELMFGASEVLVAAKHLVNDTDIRVATDLDEFEYYHILFESHQTVFSEGLPTESFHPGDMAMRSLSEDSRAEVLELFPELANDVASYGPTTHRSLKAFEAKALQSA